METQKILQVHDLKRTACREGILSVIQDSGHARSEKEIKDELTGNFDRTTFYRSFKTLLEKNIIHKIVVNNQVVKYALDNSITKKQWHAHFYCLECDSVFCLDNIPMKEPEIPPGFERNETEIIVKGLCRECKVLKK